jgi:hypothetical protein
MLEAMIAGTSDAKQLAKLGQRNLRSTFCGAAATIVTRGAISWTACLRTSLFVFRANVCDNLASQ